MKTLIILVGTFCLNTVWAGALDSNATALQRSILALDVCSSINAYFTKECATGAKQALQNEAKGIDLMNGICSSFRLSARTSAQLYSDCLEKTAVLSAQNLDINECGDPPGIFSNTNEMWKKRAKCIHQITVKSLR